MRSLQLISIFSCKALKVSWVHIKMRPLKSIILSGKYNRTCNRLLTVETFLIYRRHRKIRFNNMKLTQMSSTMALFANTLAGIVVVKIGICQFGSCLIEDIFILQAFCVVVLRGVQILNSRCSSVRELSLVSLVRRVSSHSWLHLGLESWFGSWGWGWTLR